MDRINGGCLCGALRISVRGQPDRVGLCHCLDCRKFHGTLFHASAVYPQDAVTVDGAFGDYDGRCFCPTCGSLVFSKSGDEINIDLGTLDDPNRFTPTYELWVTRRETWLPPFQGMTLYERDREEGES